MSSLILPNENPIVELCVLCTLPALYRALITIRAYNPELAKEIIREMDLPVCEEHAERISFQVEKKILAPRGIILV